MKVLITGGAGFLGTHITDMLLSEGNQVFVIDNYETASRDSLAPNEALTVVEGSITDKVLMKSLFDRSTPDLVIHSAASYKDPTNWEKDVDVNVRGTVITVNEAIRHRVKRFIYLQTALCYGAAKERPITLNHPLAPITSYSISKTAGEQYVAISELSYVSLRLANIYGARHYSGPIPTFYKKIKNDEQVTIYDTSRDFIDIDDFLSLLRIIIDKPEISGCFNVSSGVDTPIKEIYDLVAKHLSYNKPEMVNILPLISEDVASLLLDPSETKKVFDWECKISLQEGLGNLFSWYDANVFGETYTHLRIK
jgi:UDP-glucose 4-epimerase